MLTCANISALAKTAKQDQPVKPKLITTELDKQSKHVRLTKLFRILGIKSKQLKMHKSDDFILREISLVSYEIKEIKIYSF